MSNWERPDHLRARDVKYLESEGLLLQNIRQAYYLQVGQVILRVKRKFERDHESEVWIGDWIEAYTDFNAATGLKLSYIAESCEKWPELAKATENHGYTVVNDIRRMPEEFLKGFLEVIQDGHKVTAQVTHQVQNDPRVGLSKLKEKAEQMMVSILSLENDAGSSSSKYQAAEDRLNKTLLQYEKARKEVQLLNSELSEKEIILQYFKTKEKETRLRLEQVTRDPQANQKRMAAAKIVRLNQSVDCLMSTLPQITFLSEDMGIENITLLENKLHTLQETIHACKTIRSKAST